MIVLRPREGTTYEIGRASGLIQAGIDYIYPIVGRYSNPEHREQAGGARTLWHNLRNELEMLVRRIAPTITGTTGTGRFFPTSIWAAREIIVDETNNTPELIEAGRIAVTILIKPTKTVEFSGGTFILERVVRDDGRPVLEVECIPLAGAVPA